MLKKIIKTTHEEFTETPKMPIIYELEHLDTIKLTGKDVRGFLHRVTTGNVNNLVSGKVCQTIFASDKGRIIDNVHIVHMTDFFLIVCNKVNKQKLINWINKYTILEDVNISNDSDYCLWQTWNIQNISVEKVNTIMQTLYGSNYSWSHPSKTLFFWIIVKISEVENVLKKLIEDYDNIRIWSNKSYDYYRICQQLPHAPQELNEEINPHEANLTYLVDFNKGCYIGQEVIARLDTYDKVKKHLHQFSTKEQLTLSENEKVYDAEQKNAGFITSFCNSKEDTVGLIYILRKFLSCTTLYIKQNETLVPINIQPLQKA